MLFYREDIFHPWTLAGTFAGMDMTGEPFFHHVGYPGELIFPHRFQGYDENAVGLVLVEPD